MSGLLWVSPRQRDVRRGIPRGALLDRGDLLAAAAVTDAAPWLRRAIETYDPLGAMAIGCVLSA